MNYRKSYNLFVVSGMLFNHEMMVDADLERLSAASAAARVPVR